MTSQRQTKYGICSNFRRSVPEINIFKGFNGAFVISVYVALSPFSATGASTKWTQVAVVTKIMLATG